MERSVSQPVAAEGGTSITFPLRLHLSRPLGREGTIDLRLSLVSFQLDSLPWHQAASTHMHKNSFPYSGSEILHGMGGLLLTSLVLPSANIQKHLVKPGIAAHAALFASAIHKRSQGKESEESSEKASSSSIPMQALSSITGLFLRVSGASVALSGLTSLFSILLPSASQLVAASMALTTILLQVINYARPSSHSSHLHFTLIQERQLVSDLRSLSHRTSSRRANRLRRQSGYKGNDQGKLESISWQQHHKRSGLKVAKLLGSLPSGKSPPFEPILNFLSLLSFSIPGRLESGGDFIKAGISISFPTFFRATDEQGPKPLNPLTMPGATELQSSSSSTTSSSFPHSESWSSYSIQNHLPFHQAATALGLPLYGCLDHSSTLDSPTDQMKYILGLLSLLIRALYLMACFAPFAFIGVPLSLLSLYISSPDQDRQSYVTALRCVAWRLLLFGCRMTGAATIKWAQWSATRGDLFDDDFCRIMSTLHSSAPTHTFAHTKRTVEAALHCPLDEAFLTFDPHPLASASIAQVHRATRCVNRCTDGLQQDVVEEVIVKVRHPNVAEHIRKDFEIFKMMASLVSGLKIFKGLPIKESISMFSSTMTAQTDFRVEAAHLERFFVNFQGVKEYARGGHSSEHGGVSHITTPRPLWASEAVLIESFERGESVSKYMGVRGPFNSEIVSLGVSCYLSMLLRDRFVHQDLHPGNIMARTPGGSAEGKHTELVLLDFGLAEELNEEVQHRFVALLSSICSGDGGVAAEILLSWTSHEDQGCPDPECFKRDMMSLFEVECDRGPQSPGVDLDRVMKSILKLLRKHEVTIDSCYAALCISICVIIGFATSLDPAVNVIDAATSCILAWRLTGKVMGTLC